ASSGLSEQEIKEMIQQAEGHRAEDDKRRDLVDARNAADASVYSAENLLREHSHKVADDLKASLEAAANALRAARQSEDPTQIRQRISELSALVQQAASQVYAQEPAPGDGASDPAGDAGQATVDDAPQDAPSDEP
ncbi:MAG: Hsp70 family protein, partial [Chloroflexi bacterium]|nr:Hsp70 family protein [Chloroflexota bacterium]